MDAFRFISCEQLISSEEIILLLWTEVDFLLLQMSKYRFLLRIEIYSFKISLFYKMQIRKCTFQFSFSRVHTFKAVFSHASSVCRTVSTPLSSGLKYLNNCLMDFLEPFMDHRRWTQLRFVEETEKCLNNYWVDRHNIWFIHVPFRMKRYIIPISKCMWRRWPFHQPQLYICVHWLRGVGKGGSPVIMNPNPPTLKFPLTNILMLLSSLFWFNSLQHVSA